MCRCSSPQMISWCLRHCRKSSGWLCGHCYQRSSSGVGTVYWSCRTNRQRFTRSAASYSTTSGGEGGLTFRPTSTPVTVTKPTSDIVQTVVHIMNFPDFHGEGDYLLTQEREGRRELRRCGRVSLEAGGWEISIAGFDGTKGLCQALEEQGGSAVTHVGSVRRSDGSRYSTADVAGVLKCLRYFLSFVLGRWVGVILPVGFDQDGNRVFEQVGDPSCGTRGMEPLTVLVQCTPRASTRPGISWVHG